MESLILQFYCISLQYSGVISLQYIAGFNTSSKPIIMEYLYLKWFRMVIG